MEDKLEIRKIDNMDVYFRKDNTPLSAKSQPEELELVVKYLTGEEFENYDGKYKRRVINPEKFKIIQEYKDDCVYDYTCCCSEDTCNHLLIIKYAPKDIFFTVGSVCYLRFNEENSTEIYYKIKAKKCSGCNNPLIFRDGKFKKNTDKRYDDICYCCVKKKEVNERVYLFVKFEDKDDAKFLGAKWDVDKKRWYSPSKGQIELIKKYKAYPLKEKFQE